MLHYAQQDNGMTLLNIPITLSCTPHPVLSQQSKGLSRTTQSPLFSYRAHSTVHSITCSGFICGYGRVTKLIVRRHGHELRVASAAALKRSAPITKAACPT